MTKDLIALSQNSWAQRYRLPRKWRPFSVPIRRQALHALALGFKHPITGETIRVEAPVPNDLNALVAELRERTTVV